MEVYDLRRSGDLVVLDFAIRNLGDAPLGIGPSLSRDRETADVSGVYLQDAKRQKAYWPATADGRCLCSTGIGGLAAGGRLQLSATYGSPPAGIGEVAVHVPSFGVLPDVSIRS